MLREAIDQINALYGSGGAHHDEESDLRERRFEQKVWEHWPAIYRALNAVADVAEELRRPVSVATGSSICPICGGSTPHTHSQDEVLSHQTETSGQKG